VIYDTKVLPLSFPVPKNIYIGDTSHEIRGTMSPDKEASVSEVVHRYIPEPPIPGSIDIMRVHND